MDLQTALLQGRELLEDAKVAAPRLTAEVLLAHAVGRDRAWLYAHSNEELREVWWIHYGRYLHQRMQGTPTQHITGRQEFYGREFRVTPDVLIPRPETEHLIEAALRVPARSILDVGTGSGAIAVTLALESKARVVATDISIPALRVAVENVRRLGAEVLFVVGDLASVLADASFDLVVSNPPYIPESESLPREVRDHEPGVALYGGADGLEIYRRLIPEAARVLAPGGRLIMELGYGSADAVQAMLAGWNDVMLDNDLAGIPRVITAVRRSPAQAGQNYSGYL
jgi:release factor glutamine methyltransferase